MIQNEVFITIPKQDYEKLLLDSDSLKVALKDFDENSEGVQFTFRDIPVGMGYYKTLCMIKTNDEAVKLMIELHASEIKRVNERADYFYSQYEKYYTPFGEKKKKKISFFQWITGSY